MKTIAIVGSINTDMVFACKRSPVLGETVLGTKHYVSFGGKGANGAIAASRLGGNVKMFGCTGDDHFSVMAIKNLKTQRVDVKNIKKIEGEIGGIAGITVSEGTNSIVVVPGANSNVTEKYLEQNLHELLKCDIFASQFEIPTKTVLFLSRFCKENKKTFILNPSPILKYPKQIFDNATYVIVNETEIKQIQGYNANIPLEVLKKYPQKLILTVGSEGVYFSEDREIKHIDALKVKAIDTTGAGDTFMGAFMVSLSNGKSFAESITFANTCAGIKTTKIGAQTGMPTKLEVDKYLSLKK